VAWKKPSPELAEHLENSVHRFHPEKRKMFGHPVHFVNDHMFAGIFGNDIFIRLSEAERDRLFSEVDEAQPFEPLQGRPMREYAVIPESIHGHAPLFDEWLERSFRYVTSLPPRVKKTRKKST
jgi:TfoX/Sxy family transcriptional regulator of competence genes